MLIDCSTCSNASAGGGDKPRETLRLSIGVGSEGAGKALDCESSSPSASEHDSASLHYCWRPTSRMCRSLSSLEKQQSCASREPVGVIDESASRRNTRATPRDPSLVPWPRSSVWWQRNPGNHNRINDQKEDAAGLIVAKKRGNARGAKQPYCVTSQHQKRKETA